ncbi:MAG: ParA family protein [Planctomycetes bacterium]|nr:ParA family protein [Planctomycetota bacterium]
MIRIAVSNQKGGVAKTTTALSLAAGLARHGNRTLVVDLDPQANLTLGLGMVVPEGDTTVYDVLAGGRPAADAVTPTGCENLFLLPADLRLAMAERQLFGQLGFDELLREKLAPLDALYDYAVIDCPPSLGLLTLNALTAAERVLIPVQCEFYSARGMAQLLDVIAQVRARRNPELDYVILPTLYDSRNNVSRGVLAQLRRMFAEFLTSTVIGIDTKLRESAAVGVPIGDFAPRSRASAQYETLVQEMMSHEYATV